MPQDVNDKWLILVLAVIYAVALSLPHIEGFHHDPPAAVAP